MTDFFIIENKSTLYIFKKNNDSFVVQYINGNPFFKYERSSVSKNIDELMNYFRDEYNTDTTAEFSIELLDDAKSSDTDILFKAFENYCNTKLIPLHTILTSVYNKLKSDKSLMIETYGLNYNDSSYKYLNGKLVSCPFDLLAYTLAKEDIVKYI